MTAKRNKLNTPNAGPYQVISHEGNEYTLRDTTQNMELKVHVSKLIPYFEDANKTDSVDIARKDAAELVVKAILDHQPRVKSGENLVKRSKLKFLVQWADPSVEDSWEPYNGLRHNTILHTYLLTHKMKSYIPTMHKSVKTRTPTPPKSASNDNTSSSRRKRGRPPTKG